MLGRLQRRSLCTVHGCYQRFGAYWMLVKRITRIKSKRIEKKAAGTDRSHHTDIYIFVDSVWPEICIRGS